MKKYIYIITTMLMGAACAQKEHLDMDPLPTEEGKVTIEMNVTIPGSAIVTKGAMKENPVIDNIYVAVFGGNHYLNEYALAVPVNGDEIVTENGKLKYGDENGVPYPLRVTLTATESKRYIHVIANGPSQMDYMTTENDLMLNLTTSGEEGAYWQYFEVKGLGTRDEEADSYVPTEDAKLKFGNIQLIRNFAKIDIQMDPSVSNHFQLIGFKVFNKPAKGTVAMYKDDIPDTEETHEIYNNYSEWVKTETYATMKVGGTDAAKDLLKNGYYDPFMLGTVTGETATDYDNTYHAPGNPYCIYERSDGDDNNRTYVILYGKYRANTTTNWNDVTASYYRIELVDDLGIGLPIYRNFDYTITLTGIAKNGESTAAATRTANKNISSSFSAENLSDIADGFSRLFVQYLGQTFAGEEKKYAFRYMYLPDATDDEHPAPATLTLPSGNAISVYVNADEDDEDYDENYKDESTAKATWENGGTLIESGANKGWYEVFFTVPSTTTQKTSTFTVTGSRTNAQGHEVKLYRNITIDVLETKSFALKIYTYGSAANTPVDLIITLPEGLPSSMFPLELQISDSNGKLNPRTNDMPSGIDDEGHGYYFTKTVSWTDYFIPASGEEGSTDSYKTDVLCRLKRISPEGSTVYVKHPFFNTGNIALPGNANTTNYIENEGDNEVSAKATNGSVTISFITDQAWTVTADGATSITPSSGTGDASTTITLPNNTSKTEGKDYTVKIKTTGADSKEIEVTINLDPLTTKTIIGLTSSFTYSDFSAGSNVSATKNDITVNFSLISALRQQGMGGTNTIVINSSSSSTVTFTPVADTALRENVTMTGISFTYRTSWNTSYTPSSLSDNFTLSGNEATYNGDPSNEPVTMTMTAQNNININISNITVTYSYDYWE